MKAGNSRGPLVLAAALLIAASALAGGCRVEAGSRDTISESRAVGDFSGISFSLPGKLILAQGDATDVTVTASEEQLEHIVTEVDGEVLEIRHDSERWGHDHDLGEVRVEVTWVALEHLSVSGSGEAVSASMRTHRLALAISGSARVEMGSLSAETVSSAISGSGQLAMDALQAGVLDSTIAGSGVLAAAGRADSQSISITGSGEHDARRLQSRTVSAMISGSGTVDVWATGTLDAVIAGSGTVLYRGDPLVSRRVAGSGSVRQRKLEI